VPGTAAIANAIFDATGVRFREPPFTPEVVRAALHPLPAPADPPKAPKAPKAPVPPVEEVPVGPPPAGSPRRKPVWARAAALAGGALVGVLGLAGWRPAIAPVTGVNASVYTAATVERGRQLAALGNCAGCHTAAGGAINAGGRAIDTPFGVVYSSNLTPDAETGIGRWSFSAFQRAMREGISHDGRHLYPAFPYTAFTRLGDDDLTALYAYLQSRPAVAQATPEAALRAPFSARPLMALWNALYLQPGPQAVAAPPAVDTSRWQRGEYLVNGAGHCSACHTARNALGAERSGAAYLAGASVDGWQAPSLTATGRRTLPWTETALFDYLRKGHSAAHGVAVGPMAEVVTALADAPDNDLRAMAHYLASLQAAPEPAAVQQAADAAVLQARSAAPAPGPTQRLFESACGACHSEGRAAVDLGLNLPLALNSKLRADSPDNLLHVLLDGIQHPATRDIAFMPAFRQALDDDQLAALALWLRRRYAPAHAPWPEAAALRARVAQLRGAPRVDR
jgi:nicotinate dehydrogenase subunit B